MAKLSATQRLVMFLADSPYARVTCSLGGSSPSVLVSMKRGHGTKSNPRADSVLKLLNLRVLQEGEFGELELTPKGRTILTEEQARGWVLVTETGGKPRMEQKKG